MVLKLIKIVFRSIQSNIWASSLSEMYRKKECLNMPAQTEGLKYKQDLFKEFFVRTKLSSIAMITLLATFIGCGAKEKSLTLEVSAGFALTSAGYTGGLIAYGEGPQGQKFSASSAAGQSLKVTIIDGQWKIYVMGWENSSGLKFRGDSASAVHCGSSNVNLGSSTTNVNISISSANCSDITNPLVVDATPKKVIVSSCGAFYKYATGTDSFAAPTVADVDDGFCSTLPKNLQGSYEYYRLVAMNQQGASVWPGMATECLSTFVDDDIRLDVPTKKFPFQVQMYRSLKDCQNTVTPRMAVFPFPQGLEPGNQNSFDHNYMATATAGNARLFLPSSMTRRGYSPFMAILPRVLCGASPSLTDCFSSPDVPTLTSPFSPTSIQFDIPWDDMGKKGYDEGKTLIKKFATTNTNASSCPSSVLNLLNSNDNFGVKSCRIENGDVKGELARNMFTCRSTPGDISGMVDLYERNGRVYMVNQWSSNFTIYVFTTKGTFLHFVEVPVYGGQTFESMATDSNNNLYVLMNEGGPRRLYKWAHSTSEPMYPNSPTASISSSASPYTHLASVNEIEIAGDTLVTATTSQIRGVALSNLGSATSGPSVSGTIKRLLYRNSTLYFLKHDSAPLTAIHNASVSGTTIALGNSGTAIFSDNSYTFSDFHVITLNAGSYLALSPVTASGNEMRVYSMASFPIQSNGFSSTTTPAVGSKIITFGNMILGLNGTNIESYKYDNIGPSITSAQVTGGYCQANLTATIDSTPYEIPIRTNNSTTNPEVKIAFDEAFRFVGRRDIGSNNVATFFESLDDDHGEEIRTGGLTSRAEEMLGPNGLGGIVNSIFPGQSCAAIKTSLQNSGAVSRNISLFDIYDGTNFPFTISLSAPATTVHQFVCSNYPTSCSTTYDITINLVSSDERMKMQVNCSTKLGALESVEAKDASEVRRSLLLWNTDSLSATRVENYEIEDRVENSQQRLWVHLNSLEKTLPAGPNIAVRSMELNRDSAYMEGRVNEFYLSDDSGLKLMTSSKHTGSVSVANFNTSSSATVDATTVGSIVSNTDLNAYNTAIAPLCINSSDTSITSTNQSCLMPASPFSSMSMGNLTFTLDDLKTESTPYASDLFDSPIHDNIFSLTPP